MYIKVNKNSGHANTVTNMDSLYINSNKGGTFLMQYCNAVT